MPPGNTVTSDNTTVIAFAKTRGAGTVTARVQTRQWQASPPRQSPVQPGRLGHHGGHRPPAVTTGTLGAFTVVHGAATQIVLSGATTNLTSGTSRVLTATIQDAAGNTVTSDNTTVVAFAKASGAGTVAGVGQRHGRRPASPRRRSPARSSAR